MIPEREGDDVFGQLHLSVWETARFQAACKAHGRTVTQVGTALLGLAYAEATLRIAGNAGREQYDHVADTYEKATHILSGLNFINTVRT